jgi:hypothetical protein
MAGGALAGIAIANNIARLQGGIAAAAESWKVLGGRGLVLAQEEVGGFRAVSGKQRPFLRGTLDGCAVEVHVRSDFVHYATTEVEAVPPAGAEVVVGVHPSPGGVLGYLRAWLGQDVEVGDAHFDEQFLVTAKPAAAARQLLDESMRARVDALVALTGPRFGGLRYTKERVSVVLLGVEADAAVVERAVDLACAAGCWQP